MMQMPQLLETGIMNRVKRKREVTSRHSSNKSLITCIMTQLFFYIYIYKRLIQAATYYCYLLLFLALMI